MKRWWGRPDHFDWLSAYLRSRNLTAPTRRLMAMIGFSLVLVPVNTMWGPPSLDLPVVAVISFIAGISGVVWAVLWLTRWPTKNQSIAFAMTGSVCIVLGSLGQADPIIAMMAVAALAVPGGYLAFFHTAPTTVVNFALAVVVAGVAGVRIASTGEMVLAWTACFMVLELNVAVPLAIQIVVGALGIDLLNSDRDPLTGLLNRRAIQQAAVDVLAAEYDAEKCLVIAMVDLDRFKSINDTRGHAVGDAALASVGEALRDSVQESAVVGRVGGEEFLVVDILHPASAADFGEHLCSVVSGVSFWPPLTASVGTVTFPQRPAWDGEAVHRYHDLVRTADAAMYVAKRSGGNRAHHWGWWDSGRVADGA